MHPWLAALIIFLTTIPAAAETLELDLAGMLRGDSAGAARAEIFRGRFLLPTGETREIFTGPYTIRLSALKLPNKSYEIALEFFGLGPAFDNSTFKTELVPPDSIVVPPLPVKDGVGVKYTLRLLRDTAAIESPDSTSWGTSETVHYRTHWIVNSYADFLWNVKMGYLELVYDGYRKSFGLSEFDKIDFHMHPEPTNAVYLDPVTNYAIEPRDRRIDLVFGHEIDAASPRPMAELLMYRQWGYGPRWMTAGFSCYYEDVFLQARKLAPNFKADELMALFANEAWTTGDTGRVVTGAFAKWLVDTESISKFQSLYKASTSLDFPGQFQRVYKKDFAKAAGEFLAFAKSYQPKKGELGYFASEHMKIGNFERASEYLREEGNTDGLALCEFWLGNYEEADQISRPNPFGDGTELNLFNANMMLAKGRTDEAVRIYRWLFSEKKLVEAGVPLASICLDQGKIAEATGVIDSLNGVTTAPEYFIEAGRLRLMRGEKADSILTMAAAVAMNRSQTQPNEPVNYLLAGQAFLLMGKYDMARDNLGVAQFLESRPFFLGQTLLEMGKLADLEGRRDEAKDYYGRVMEIKAGAYQKTLVGRYLKQRFAQAEGKK